MNVIKFYSTRLVGRLDLILLSLVLNINVLRFFFNTEENNLLLYSLYIFCIIFLYKNNKSNIINIYISDKSIRLYCGYWLCLLCYSLISSVLLVNGLFLFFKFLVSVIIALLCVGIKYSRIQAVIKYYILVNIIYSICIYINPQKVFSYMSGTVNYLNMTLTLGFCLSLFLVQGVNYYYSDKGKLLLQSLVGIVIFFIVIMLFPARGVLIFPPMIVLYIAYKNRKRSIVKFWIFIVALTALIYFAFYYFMQHASEYALVHMTGLFENTEGESRITVWDTAINAIIDNYWMFIGAGFDGFNCLFGYYPHNIFLHILADFGFIPLIGFIIIIVYVFRNYNRICIKMISKTFISSFQLCFAGFLYYLLTFCKSFSMYDACPLLIMISLCFVSILTINNSIALNKF